MKSHNSLSYRGMVVALRLFLFVLFSCSTQLSYAAKDLSSIVPPSPLSAERALPKLAPEFDQKGFQYTQKDKIAKFEQSSDRVKANFETFDIATGHTVSVGRADDANKDMAFHALFNVTGKQESQLLGNLRVDSNHNLYFSNPNGIFLGGEAKVNLSKVMMTTGKIDFDNMFEKETGKLKLFRMKDIVTDAKGKIEIAKGAQINIGGDRGYLVLLGSKVVNEGAITVTTGTKALVSLSAGEQFALDSDGEGLIYSVHVTKGKKDAIAEHRGTIVNHGGVTNIDAQGENSIVNVVGVIHADTIARDGEAVYLSGKAEDQANFNKATDNKIVEIRAKYKNGETVTDEELKATGLDVSVPTIRIGSGTKVTEEGETKRVRPETSQITFEPEALNADLANIEFVGKTLQLGEIRDPRVVFKKEIDNQGTPLTFNVYAAPTLNFNIDGEITATKGIYANALEVTNGFFNQEVDLSKNPEATLPDLSVANHFSLNPKNGKVSFHRGMTGADGKFTVNDIYGFSGAITSEKLKDTTLVLGADIDASPTEYWGYDEKTHTYNGLNRADKRTIENPAAHTIHDLYSKNPEGIKTLEESGVPLTRIHSDDLGVMEKNLDIANLYQYYPEGRVDLKTMLADGNAAKYHEAIGERISFETNRIPHMLSAERGSKKQEVILAAQNKKIAKLKALLESKKQEIEKRSTELSQSVSDLTGKVKAHNEEVGNHTIDHDTLVVDISAFNGRVVGKEEALKSLKTQVDGIKKKVEEHSKDESVLKTASEANQFKESEMKALLESVNQFYTAFMNETIATPSVNGTFVEVDAALTEAIGETKIGEDGKLVVKEPRPEALKKLSEKIEGMQKDYEKIDAERNAWIGTQAILTSAETVLKGKDGDKGEVGALLDEVSAFRGKEERLPAEIVQLTYDVVPEKVEELSKQYYQSFEKKPKPEVSSSDESAPAPTAGDVSADESAPAPTTGDDE